MHLRFHRDPLNKCQHPRTHALHGPEDKKVAPTLWGGALLGAQQVPGFCASPFQEPLHPRLWSPMAEQHGALGIRGLPSKGPRARVPTKDSERPSFGKQV